MDILIDKNIIFGFFTLLGVFIGGVITSFTQKNLEIIKLHDKDKINAYKKLLIFVEGLEGITWPDNASVYSDFIYNCRKELYSFIEYYPYFSKKVIYLMEEIKSLYNMTKRDLQFITPPQEAIKKELPKVANRLYQQIITDFKKWKY